MNDTEKLAATQAELARTKAELDTHIAALTPGPFQNTTITPQMQDAARAERKARVDAAIKERQERDAKLAKEREAAMLEAGRQRLEDFEGQAHQRFINNGGSEADWRSAWPRMKQDYLIEESKVDPRERRVQEMVEQLRASGAYQRF